MNGLSIPRGLSNQPQRANFLIGLGFLLPC
jgi:hypothetical protein